MKITKFLNGTISIKHFQDYWQQINTSIFLIYLSTFGYTRSSLLQGLPSHCSAQASHCGGFSCGAWALGQEGFSNCGSHALEHRLNSCGTWAYLLHGVWDLPGPGIKPVSPALVGRFLSSVPPGKSLLLFLIFWFFWQRHVDLSSLARDWTCTPCPGRWSPNR